MADRILTRGLKTGTGVGGVKYILLRGLISSAAALSLETTIQIVLNIDQGRNLDLHIDRSRSVVLNIDQARDFDLEL